MQRTPATDVREATPEQVRAWVRAQGREVIGFFGYSGAQYEDPAAMLAIAEAALRKADPARTLVLSGATAEGIGAVYEVARRLGFVTVGIVSTQARAQGARLSDNVDTVFYVPDATWGGILPGTTTIAPTSEAMVGAVTRCIAIGGGDVVRDELSVARRRGIPVEFHPADLDHALAHAQAARRGEPLPTDFSGAAQTSFDPKR